MKLGTILPTKKSLAINAQYAARLADQKQAVAKAAGLKSPKNVGGELQYKTNDGYCIVSRNLKVLYFRVDHNGHAYAK